MKCLDQLDMAVMAGAVAIVASAAFMWGYLPIERGPLTPPEPAAFASELRAELADTVATAQTAPLRAEQAAGMAQERLGTAIVDLTRLQGHYASIIPTLVREVSATQEARVAFLYDTWKLPADWKSPEFQAQLNLAKWEFQPVIGHRIVDGTLTMLERTGMAEERYGNAVVTAHQTMAEAARQPAASTATILGAAAAVAALDKETAPSPEPVVTRDPSWGYGSIGDGVFLPIAALGAGVGLILIAATAFGRGNVFLTHTREEYCDTAGKEVELKVLVSDDTPYEVTHCSVFNGGPITCDKHCLKERGHVVHAA